MQVEEKYMLRCLELAQAGKSSVAPNPIVGAVIVHKGHIIGEGYHRQYGGAHAEVNAICCVSDKTLLRDSTLYVNLEPCAHRGKTSPCTDLIIQKQIPRVVVGCLDPFPQVAGRGVKRLCDAGVEVVTNVMKDEAIAINRFFMTAHTKQRPYIILKWAQSADGYLDCIRKDASEQPVQLSIPSTRRYVHKLRSEISAIMVGTNTAWLDNPSLTVRHWIGESPVRVFIDRTLRIPQSYHLLDGTTRTLIFTEKFKHEGTLKKASCIARENVEYIQLDFSKSVVPQILRALYERQLYSLLIEGGACLHKSFLDSGLWDELQIETASEKLEFGVKSPVRTLSEIAYLQNNIDFLKNNSPKKSLPIISIYTCKNM